eukprot:29176-Lingulodinium_polyedra.AAC.1
MAKISIIAGACVFGICCCIVTVRGQQRHVELDWRHTSTSGSPAAVHGKCFNSHAFLEAV